MSSWFESTVPVVGVPILRAWMWTIRMRWCRGEHLRQARELSDRVIYAFWHEDLLYFVWSHRQRGVHTMISQHRDGALVANAVERLGFRTSRGSTTRGGPSALREMIRSASADRDFGITPDGPQGPRRTVQPGVLTLARHTGLTILPAGVAYARCRRLRSWDRMAVPFPGTRGVVLFAEPLQVGRGADERELETLRDELQKRMRAASEEAARDLDRLFRDGTRDLAALDPVERSGAPPTSG